MGLAAGTNTDRKAEYGASASRVVLCNPPRASQLGCRFAALALGLFANFAIYHPGASHTVAPPDNVVMCGFLQVHRKFQHAIEHCDVALATDPNASNYFNRGLVHAAAEQHERAIVDFTRALELMPTLTIAYNNRGLAYEKLGDREKAITDFRAALATAPNLKMIENNLRRLGVAP